MRARAYALRVRARCWLRQGHITPYVYTVPRSAPVCSSALAPRTARTDAHGGRRRRDLFFAVVSCQPLSCCTIAAASPTRAPAGCKRAGRSRSSRHRHSSCSKTHAEHGAVSCECRPASHAVRLGTRARTAWAGAATRGHRHCGRRKIRAQAAGLLLFPAAGRMHSPPPTRQKPTPTSNAQIQRTAKTCQQVGSMPKDQNAGKRYWERYARKVVPARCSSPRRARP